MPVRRRLDPLRTDALPRPIGDGWTKGELFDALEQASRLPDDPGRLRPGAGGADTAAPAARRAIWPYTHGLRVFGWTTAYCVPWAVRM